MLREGHRARVEPHVDHLGHAAHRLAACALRVRAIGRVRAREARLVHEGPVVILQPRARTLRELREGAHHVRVPARAAPNRQRRPPVALAGERPVDVVLQPVTEASVLHVRREPVDRLVAPEQLLAHAEVLMYHDGFA